MSTAGSERAILAEEPVATRALALVIVTQLVYGCCWSTFLLLPKFLTTELHASASEIGLVSAIPTCTGALSVPWVGRMIDRVGRRPLITFGAALAVVQAFSFVFVDRIGPLLVFLQLLCGLSFVLAFNAAGALTADLAPRARLGQVLGIFGAANVATNAIAPAIGEPLANEHGWDLVFMLAGGMGIIAFVLSFALRDPPRAPRASVVLGRDTAKNLRLYVVAMAAAGMAFAIAFAFYQPFALSLGMHELRSFFIGYATCVVITRVALGSLPDRIGRMRMTVFSLALYAVVELAMAKLAPGTLAIYGALFGCAHGFLYPSLNALAVEEADPAERGKIMTYINGGFQVGYTVALVVFGWVAEHTGFPTIFVLGGTIMAIVTVAVARHAQRGRGLTSHPPADA